MGNGDGHIDYELIARYLANEASADERQEVALWRSANPQHFSRLAMLWEHTGRITSHEEADVDVDKAWAQFKNMTAKNPGGKVRPLFSYLARVAAMLVVGFTMYLIYQNFIKAPVKEMQLASASEVLTDSLPDGSIVSLNSQTRLTYPEKFEKRQRQVKLNGEAFFKVTPNKEKPFVIDAQAAIVTVLGTAFYVKAYDSLNTITVGVEEGTVKVSIENAEVVLHAGERLDVDKSTQNTTPVTTYNPNNVYWKTKTLIFQNEPLKNVFPVLEQTYSVSIAIENPKILNCKLTAKFQLEPADRIFEMIDANFNLTFERQGDQVTISGKGCE